MPKLAIEEGDAVAFIKRVEAISDGLCRGPYATELLIVRIDNWFGPRWLRFSGKLMGLVGVSKRRLTLPPFVPTRVVWQHRYEKKALENWNLVAAGPPLHIEQRTESNFKRQVSDIPGSPIILWFSGNSADNGRGSVMAYVPDAIEWWTWYVELVEHDRWIVEKRKGISSQELTLLEGEVVA